MGKNNPYAYKKAPEGYAHLTEMDPAEQHTLDAFREHFAKAVTRLEQSGGYLQEQRIVYWLARRLATHYSAANDSQRNRAILETALSLVTDPGYRHLLHCALSVSATKAGELEAAEAWLAPADPRPVILQLDSSYRGAQGALQLAHEQWQHALDIVGRRRKHVTCAPSSALSFAATRVTAKRTAPLSIPAPELEGLTSSAREPARLALLAHQAKTYDEQANPYSYANTPPGYAYLLRTTFDDPLTAALMLRAFFDALERCEAANHSLASEQSVYWTATRLINLLAEQVSEVRTRAVIETAYEALADPVFQSMLTLDLADAARSADDMAAAQAWLALCHPAPTRLEMITHNTPGQIAPQVSRDCLNEPG